MEQQGMSQKESENMAVYAGSTDTEYYLPHAKELLRRFRAIEKRDPTGYAEIEEWSLHHVDQKGGKFMVFSKSTPQP